MKTCSKCKTSKPLDEFFRYRKDQEKRRSECKECRREARRQGRIGRKEQRAIVYPEPGTKRCSRCEEVLPLEQFVSRGGARGEEKRAYCKACAKQGWNAWHRKHGGVSRAERVAEIRKQNRPDKHSKRCAACGIVKSTDEFQKYKQAFDGLRWRCKECRSAEEAARYDPEAARKKRKEHRTANPDRYRANAVRGFHKRRARLAEVESTLTQKEWEAVLDRYGRRCLCCGTLDNITMDHVIPISRGGADVADNVQPLCGSCNSAKHTKIIDYRAAERVAY